MIQAKLTDLGTHYTAAPSSRNPAAGQTETGVDARASGTVNRNVAPPSGLFVASIVPPCAAAIR